MLDKSKLIVHKDSREWYAQHQSERYSPINPRVRETDIDKSAQKRAKGSGLKGLMNNLPAKAGG
jgi:hypothetical protein